MSEEEKDEEKEVGWENCSGADQKEEIVGALHRGGKQKKRISTLHYFFFY